MTFREAEKLYPVETVIVSHGDTYRSIVYRVYNSSTNKQVSCIFALNPRVDWEELLPGQEIRYLSKEVLANVDEVSD